MAEKRTSSSAFLFISSFQRPNELDGLSPYKDKDSHYKSRSSFYPPFPRVMFCNPFEIFMCLAQVYVVVHLSSALAPPLNCSKLNSQLPSSIISSTRRPRPLLSKVEHAVNPSDFGSREERWLIASGMAGITHRQHNHIPMFSHLVINFRH